MDKEELHQKTRGQFSIAMLFDDDDLPEGIALIIGKADGSGELVSIFNDPETLKNIIENLIAYRRYLCPTAPDVDATVSIEDINSKKVEGEI